MRILALTNLYPSPWHPHRAPFNRQQFRALAGEHQVQVIAPVAWTAESWKSAHAAGTPDAVRRRISDGIVVHHPRYTFTPKVLRRWYGHFMLRSVRRTFREVAASFRPDVVLGSWAYPDGWAAVQLAREAGLPVAIKVHGSDVLTLEHHPNRRRRTMEALRSADAVIAVSRHLADSVVSLGVPAACTHVVYNGVDPSVFRPGDRADASARLGLSVAEPTILFVGNLVAVKGLDILLDALSSLDRAGLAFRCCFVGDGPLKARLQRDAAARGLNGRLRFVGSRPLNELPLWYQAADLLVLPSRSEGVPNVLLEAAACGTPSIATRVGGIAEVMSDDCLVPPGDSAALAECIKNRLCTPRTEHRRPIASWADSARVLADVLRQAVAAARASARIAS